MLIFFPGFNYLIIVKPEYTLVLIQKIHTFTCPKDTTLVLFALSLTASAWIMTAFGTEFTYLLLVGTYLLILLTYLLTFFPIYLF